MGLLSSEGVEGGCPLSRGSKVSEDRWFVLGFCSALRALNCGSPVHCRTLITLLAAVTKPQTKAAREGMVCLTLHLRVQPSRQGRHGSWNTRQRATLCLRSGRREMNAGADLPPFYSLGSGHGMVALTVGFILNYPIYKLPHRFVAWMIPDLINWTISINYHIQQRLG